MRANVRRFPKITCAGIQGGIQVIDFRANSMRHAVVTVAAVIVGSRRKSSSERVNPGTGADAVLIAIQAGGVWIRAPRAELWTWVTGRARVTSAANTIL